MIFHLVMEYGWTPRYIGTLTLGQFCFYLAGGESQIVKWTHKDIVEYTRRWNEANGIQPGKSSS